MHGNDPVKHQMNMIHLLGCVHKHENVARLIESIEDPENERVCIVIELFVVH